jgi:protein translocase SecG subunit
MFDILVTLITVFYVIICILMILIILLQAGRGGMGTALGGGASQSVFGGGGSSDVLAKITQSCAAGFMIFAMFLAYASAHSGSTNLKAKSEENNAEERAAGEDDVVDYEKIGPNPMRLPERRAGDLLLDPANRRAPADAAPTAPAVPSGPAPADAAPADAVDPAPAAAPTCRPRPPPSRPRAKPAKPKKPTVRKKPVEPPPTRPARAEPSAPESPRRDRRLSLRPGPHSRMTSPSSRSRASANDFLLIDLRPPTSPDAPRRSRAGAGSPLRAPTLCDRRTGVGGDGLLLVTPPDPPGSPARWSSSTTTAHAPRCAATASAASPSTSPTRQVRCSSTPTPARASCPSTPRATRSRSTWAPPCRATATSPAAASPPSRSATRTPSPSSPPRGPRAARPQLGPLVERDPQFPARTNVEFARREPDGSLTLWVWERGCGITAACGTGACATLAAAVATGLAPADVPIRVQLPGGPLTIRWPTGRVWMTGPARFVFRGAVA